MALTTQQKADKLDQIEEKYWKLMEDESGETDLCTIGEMLQNELESND